MLQQIGGRGGGGEKSKASQCDEHKIQTMGERRQKLMTCNSGIQAHGGWEKKGPLVAKTLKL